MTPHRAPTLFAFTVAFLLFASGCSAEAQQKQQQQPHKETLELGTLSFPTSASGEAQQAFLRGVLALHSFWYPQARDYFQRAQQLDSAFAMAYWGEAMTYDHPLWDQQDTDAARAVLAPLDSLAVQGALHWTAREQDYVEALRVLYTGEGDVEARRRAYAEAMNELAEQYPKDDEAAVFAALAAMSIAGFDFDDPGDVVPVAAALEEVFKRNPEHPGAAHYLIHVYDSPTFAPMGLRPARVYARIAPAAPHALHMPSHIFRELDMWEKVVASNVEAWEASVAWQKRTGRPLKARDYHSFRWLFDAYLELGRYEEARRLLGELEEVEAEARRRGEDLGRIPSLAERLKERYEQAVKKD